MNRPEITALLSLSLEKHINTHNDPRIPQSVRKAVYQKYGGRCAYCGCELEYKDMQADHIVPVYHISPLHWDNLGNEIENLMPSCRMCNFYKSTFSIKEFRERLQTLTDRLEKHLFIGLPKSTALWKNTISLYGFILRK